MAASTTLPSDRRPTGNPFPVYPVQPLTELLDVRAATVETHEVKIVRDAVLEFAKGFDPRESRPPRHLVMAIKGDFGTGKTHVMLYALSLLEAQVRTTARQNDDPGSTSPPDEVDVRSRALLVVANETSIEDWYGAVLGPALIRSARPRELLRELMTEVACEVALENQKTRHFAQIFRDSPQEMFEILRVGDEIDQTKIEQRFLERIAQLAPEADEGFCRTLAALRWTESATLAERWLACVPITEQEATKLGLSQDGDRALRAATFIAALAAICRALNRPFALFVDEFEHLARHDTRNSSRRNVTWLKRLVEALSRGNAMVFVSGHWKAWEQLGDFLDRFTGRPALQLVRLDTNDIASIVRVYAPSWSENFPDNAASTLADVTSGNIRRVMTVLFDLYARVGASGTPVTAKLVSETAAQRLHRAPEEGFLGTVEQAVRAKGGTLERDAILAGGRFDGIARVDGTPRLVIRVFHARDEATLLEQGEKLADEVRTIRRAAPRVRGLFIALGAVNSEHLRTLDAARTEVDVVDGEDSEIGPKVSKLVTAALEDESETDTKSSKAEVESLRAELLQLRQQVLDRSAEQIERAKEEFGKDERSTAVRESVTPEVEDLARQKAEIEGRQGRERVLDQEKQRDTFAYLKILNSPFFYVPLFLGIFLLIVGDDLARQLANSVVRMDIPPPDRALFTEGPYRTALLVCRLSGTVLILAALIILFFNVLSLVQFQRYRLQTLENFFDDGASANELRRLRLLMDRAVDTVGLRHAAAWTDDRLPEFERRLK